MNSKLTETQRGVKLIEQLTLNKKCLSHRTARNVLVNEGFKSNKLKSASFEKAWKLSVSTKVIVEIEEGDDRFKECSMKEAGARKLYVLGSKPNNNLHYDDLNLLLEKPLSETKFEQFIDVYFDAIRKSDGNPLELLLKKFLENVEDIDGIHIKSAISLQGRIIEGIRYGFDQYRLRFIDGSLLSKLKSIATKYGKQSKSNDMCNETFPLGLSSSAFGLVWKIDRENGKALFLELSKSFTEAIAKWNEEDLNDIGAYVYLMNCYLSHVPEFVTYLSIGEKSEVYKNLLKIVLIARRKRDVGLIASSNALMYQFA